MQQTEHSKRAACLARGGAAARAAAGWALGWFRRNFSGSTPALCLAASLAGGVVVGVSLADTYFHTPAGYALASLAFAALLLLGLSLGGWLLRRLLGRSLRAPAAAGVLAAASIEFFRRGAGEGYSLRVVAVALAAAAAVWCFSASWWAILRRRRATAATLSLGAVSAAAVALLAVFLFTDGFDDHYRARYLALGEGAAERLPALEPSLGPGPYTVAVMDYGGEGGVPSDTVNLTAFVSRSSDRENGAYADWYLDYDLNAVPLVGRVWYPVEAEGCPVLFIAHGNHEITVDSYLGYDYLGEYLASHGYVVVSTDHNACNLLYHENDGRAVLLLEHIGQVLQYNKTAGNPLAGKIDGENIAIGGHSRGGEMAATAYLFNQYDRYPENGSITFDYHYPIRSVVAIAPTVNQYKPADHSVRIEDVNYLLLHGSNDRDVTSFMGMAQYENVTFSGEGDYLKTALYIAGANHGQFNTLWGDWDQSAPFAALLNTESLLSAGDQQAVARVFIKVFLDVTLKGDQSCRQLLTDWDSCAAQLPRTVYYQCYETSDFALAADFEEDSDLETLSLAGASAAAEGMSLWREELVDFADESSFGTHALRLTTHSVGSRYTITLPAAADLTGRAVTLDVMDADEEAVEEGDGRLVDFTVTLTDSAGRTASGEIGDYASVYPGLPVRYDKLDYVFGNCAVKTAFETVTLPVSSLAAEEGFDSSQVVSLTLSFSRRLELMLDNIGFTAAQPF